MRDDDRTDIDRQTEGRTDMKKLIFAFRSFVNTPDCYDKSEEVYSVEQKDRTSSTPHASLFRTSLTINRNCSSIQH